MKLLESLQRLGSDRQVGYLLSGLVRKATLNDKDLKSFLEPLFQFEDLDQHFADRIDKECKEAPWFELVRHVLSIYAEIKSCLLRIKKEMKIIPIPLKKKTATNDFLVKTDNINFLVEVKTKFRPLKENSIVLLERIIQGIKEEKGIKSFEPPYHSDYFTLSCNCSELRLNSLNDCDISLIAKNINARQNQILRRARFLINDCSVCKKKICLNYSPDKAVGQGFCIDTFNIEKKNLENLIVKILDEAKGQLTANPALRDLEQRIDIYLCVSNSLMVDFAINTTAEELLRNFTFREAKERGIHLDIFECPGWL